MARGELEKLNSIFLIELSINKLWLFIDIILVKKDD